MIKKINNGVVREKMYEIQQILCDCTENRLPKFKGQYLILNKEQLHNLISELIAIIKIYEKEIYDLHMQIELLNK
jgi:hypothetical protein